MAPENSNTNHFREGIYISENNTLQHDKKNSFLFLLP